MSDRDLLQLADLLEACSFEELCQRRLLDADFIVHCVEAGIVDVHAQQPLTEWRFTTQTVLRIERALRLQRDLDMQLQDLALVLDLLDEVQQLREEVVALRRRLQHWEHQA
ncbi:MAG: chaperone modulator CbpM [Pseudohongiellaceae bacterium]